MLGVLDDQRVLLGVEPSLAAIVGISAALAAQLGQQRDDLVFARFVDPARRQRIFLFVAAVGLEALEGASGRRKRLRIGSPQVTEHLVERIPQAVHIQAVEAGLALIGL